MDRDEEIRLIAYQIWEQEGQPHGCEVKHWQKAEATWQYQHSGAQLLVSQPELPTQSTEDQTRALTGSLQEALYRKGQTRRSSPKHNGNKGKVPKRPRKAREA